VPASLIALLTLYSLAWLRRWTKGKPWGKDYTTAPVLVKRVLDTDKDSEIGWALNYNSKVIARKA
jgi:hypothetical protein